ncbi:MAG: rhodanese-like domain-containing protein [Chloroflexota bacterium]|nr:rhodanese-like domain-containing protein [Chloroflexota bacterium]
MKPNRLMLIAAVAIIAAVALVAFTQMNTSPAANSTAGGLLSPAGYQQQFVSAAASHILVDVRTPEEYAEGHIAGSVNIPLQGLENRLSEFPTDRPIVVYCRSGNRSAQAATILQGAGFTPVYDLGGIIDWTTQGYSIVQ